MSYEKLGYRINKCHQDHEDCWQVEVNEVVDGENKWTPILFHMGQGTATKECLRTQSQFEHEKACQHRIFWNWNSSVRVERQREIDLWYNSLTDNQRSMIDDINEERNN